MIEKVKAYSVEGRTFNTLEEAQKHGIGNVLTRVGSPLLKNEDGHAVVASIADFIVEQKEEVLAILSTKERKARTPKVPKPRGPRKARASGDVASSVSDSATEP